MMVRLLTAVSLLFAASAAQAQMRISEWMYSGGNGEFIEFTNMGGAPVNTAGWAYSDSDQGANDLDISAFGIVQPGESVILTETADAAFRTAWGLSPAVKVIGSNVNSNLGRADEINLFNAGVLVDRLTYGDNRDESDPPVGAPNTNGSIRTQNRSGNPSSLAALGANDVFQWELASTSGTDPYGSTTSAAGDRANPGFFYLAVPEPSSFAITLLSLCGFGLRRRR
jgi:predicted extracellular nuclease